MIKSIVILFFVFDLFAYQEGELIAVGENKPIELPFRDPASSDSAAKFIDGLAPPLAAGQIGKIYSSGYGKVVKLVKASDVKSGDEIRASEIAGNLGVAPKFYGAWVTHKKEQPADLYVVLSMAYLSGEKLGAYVPMKSRDFSRDLLYYLQRLFRNRGDGGKTYFFDRFFTILEKLAENKVSWADAHFGNIMVPELPSWQELKIVDFDSAKIHDSEKAAAAAMLGSVYVSPWVTMFEKLSPNDQGEIAKSALSHLEAMARGNL